MLPLGAAIAEKRLGQGSSYCPQQGSHVRSREWNAETHVLIGHHFTLRWAKLTNRCDCSWQSNLESWMVWVFKIFLQRERENMSKGLLQSKILPVISILHLPYPLPPIRNCLYLQSISSFPAPPGLHYFRSHHLLPRIWQQPPNWLFCSFLPFFPSPFPSAQPWL